PFGASAVVTITLKGKGNLPLVQAPSLWLACGDCESYPPEEESAVTIDRSGIHGSRSWSMTLLPRTSGELILEPVTLAVFNPASDDYESHRLGPLTLMVEAPIPTPTPVRHVPATGVADGHDDGVGNQPEFDSGRGEPSDVPIWVIVGSALLIGVLGGGLQAWLVTRRRGGVIPARKAGQRPSERARDLQLAMEQWWVGLSDDQKFGAREAEMKAVRKALEAIRFAPGRADHSETARDLEKRLRALVR
ncbi:MAG: BatD family protein, partial [Lentisphaeria bacterium]|nr:BatD family protein [Lentisphaeria bacterium]